MNQPESPSEIKQADKQPISVAENNELTEENKIDFFPVSEGKLITLYILSFCVYGVYWFYKNWKLQ